MSLFPILDLIAQAAFSAIFAMAFAGTMLTLAVGVLVYCCTGWKK